MSRLAGVGLGLGIACLAALPFALPKFRNAPAAKVIAVTTAPAPAVDFWAAEMALARIARDEHGDPRLDAATEALLSAAVAALPASPTPQSDERIALLMRKSFPGSAQAGLAVLFDEYRRYRAAEIEQRETQPSPRDLADEIAGFEATVALRQRYFGKQRAQALFGRQQALTRHLFALRRLEADPALSEAAREQQRRTLQTEYEQRVRDSAR